jgi:hypothetical protein
MNVTGDCLIWAPKSSFISDPEETRPSQSSKDVEFTEMP